MTEGHLLIALTIAIVYISFTMALLLGLIAALRKARGL